MNKLTDFSMKNITAVIIIVFLLFSGGSYAATQLKLESMPDISFPVVIVTTTYLAPPKDVMEDVTKPLEKSVSSIEGLKNLTSTSRDNFSQIMIELEQSYKPDDVKKDVESLVANVKLPQGAERPKVLTFGFASEPVYYLSLYGQNGMNQMELDRLYKDVIEPGLNSVNGIDHIDSIGNQEATLNLKLDVNALNNYGLNPASVTQMIRASLMSSPAGSVEFNGNTQMVRVKGEYNTIYSLENMRIATPKGDVLLKQIAKVDAINEAKHITRLNDQPAIGVHLAKTKNANAVEFAAEVDTLIAQWEAQYPNIKFHTVYNAAISVKESIAGMVKEGALGAILASVMILLFLRNMRMTLIVLVSIPLSILVTVMFMMPLDISLNIMTLGGIAIAIGRVVDDSIVVIENIYAQLVKAHERNESVIKLATKQVSSAITSSTLTTVGVFGPIGFVSGVVGEIFRPFALTIAIALMSSLLVALTVIPMLAKLLVLNSKNLPVHDETKIGPMMSRYKRAIEWSLKNRIKTLAITAIVFVVSMAITVPQLPSGFMPDTNEDKQMFFEVKMPRETSLETMNAKMKEIEAIMRSKKDAEGQPQYTYIESMVGFENGSTDKVPYKAMIFTEASKISDAKAVVKDTLEAIKYELPANSTVSGDLLAFSGGGTGGADFSYLLKGDDLVQLQAAAEIVKKKLAEFPELTDVKDSLSESKKEIEVLVDSNKAKLYGLTTAQVLDSVRIWIAEDKIGDIRFDNVLFKTKVTVDPKFKDSVAKIAGFTIKTQTGQTIALGDIARVREMDAPAVIQRENESISVRVNAKIDAVDKGGVSTKVAAALDTLELPGGVTREVKGVTDDIEQSFMDMFVAMGASIFIVYLIMVLAFGNAGSPFAILFSLPLAAIGGLFGLLFTGESINVTSLIGFLMLIGVVVTNAIVLVDRVQQLRAEGHTVFEALVEAGVTRLRPIIMTAGATILALMPLALGLSKGTIISKGLAVVVIGGLLTSTILTLVVVPVVYSLIESFKGRVARLFRKKQKATAVEGKVVVQQ